MKEYLRDEIERLRMWRLVMIFLSIVCLSFVIGGAVYGNHLLVLFAFIVSLLPLLSLANISIRPDGTSQMRWLKSRLESELDEPQ